MKILMVLTSHDQLGNTGRKTGFWLEELAAPYYVFKDAGAEITLASPKGGRPPLDPKSNEPESRTDLTRPVREGRGRGSSARQDCSPRQRQAGRLRHRLLPGRPWPDVGSRRRQALRQADRVLPCRRQANRASSVIPRVRCVTSRRQTASFWLQGKEVTGFTNGEEEAVGLTTIVPFLVEDEMLKLGAIFSKKANWEVHVVSDGLLITGQNPHSSGPAAKTLLAKLKQMAKPAIGARAS